MDHSRPTDDASMANSLITSRKSDDQSRLTRSPLSNRANIQLGTTTTNWDHKDSSEDQPSTHESICDAAWISTSDVATSPYQTPGRPVTPPVPISIDIDSESPLSFLETSFLYGYGTELAPILEQRSIATLQTKGSQSTSDLSSLLHDAPGATNTSESGKKHHSKSDNTIPSNPNPHSTLHPLRRQHPFTPIDNAAGTSASEDRDSYTYDYDESTTSGFSSPQLKCLSYSRPTVHVVDVHAYPRKPVYAPPQRAATPPSLRRVPRPRSEGDAYMTSTSSLAGVAYEAPGFRAPRSGHGNLSAHPFMRAAGGGGGGRTTTHSGIGAADQRQRQHQSSTPADVRLRREGGGGGGAMCRRGNEGLAARLRSSTRGSGLDVGYSNPDLHLDQASGRELESETEPEPRGGTCKKCRHPRGESWSLFSTLVGRGPGMRRGPDWCGRCAWRKVVHEWCCGE